MPLNSGISIPVFFFANFISISRYFSILLTRSSWRRSYVERYFFCAIRICATSMKNCFGVIVVLLFLGCRGVVRVVG